MSDRLRYLAAVLDYNDSIRMKMQRGVLVPMISVHHSDYRHASIFRLTFGGNLIERKSGFVFQRSHGQAVEVVRKVRPHLILNYKIADQVLEWKPLRPPVHVKVVKVPCPIQCGNMMTPGSKSCLPCFDASNKKVKFKPVAEVKPEPKIIEPVIPPKETKPEVKNFLIEPPIRQHERTLTGRGEIINTPTGRIHRLRG